MRMSCLQRASDRLEREVKERAESRLDVTQALYDHERHNKNKVMEARAKQDLIAAARDI